MGAGIAAVAVLPMPSETETWWTSLLHREEPRIHIAARLPFWASRPEGSPAVQALVVSPAAPDPSEHDRTLVGLELEQDISRDRLSGRLRRRGPRPGRGVGAAPGTRFARWSRGWWSWTAT